jgi:HlyD family secretion protein
MSSAPVASANWRPFAFSGFALILLTFGVAGGWAAITKIDRAVVAPATVSIETNRKIVQHFEGGIVREILVKEGQSVSMGQVLIRLQEVQAQANMDLLRNQLATNRAIEARLVAERDQAKEIVWPPEVLDQRSDPMIQRVMTDQAAQFKDRAASLNGQVDVLMSRISQLRTEISGLRVDKESTEKGVEYINRELKGLRELIKDELVPVTKLYAMERERTRLEGVIGRSLADMAKCEGQIQEINIQIQQLRKKFQEEVAGLLTEVRQKIDDSREKLAVAKDVLRRVDIVSPRAGTVQNLKVASRGQVIRSGEVLLEIVPQDEPLVVNAQFSPNDIDGVTAGQEVEIRFPAFHMRTLPVMVGRLASVSHDRLIDEQSKQPYFLGIVSIERSQIPEQLRSRIRSGMPAEVIAASGERTVLQYIVSPLRSAFRKSFIER